MSEAASQNKTRRKRCLNCDQKFAPNEKTPAQLGQWRKQKFCSTKCRSEYHQLLGGTKIRAAVLKLVHAELNRWMPEFIKAMKPIDPEVAGKFEAVFNRMPRRDA